MSIAHSAPFLHDAHTSALSAAERSRVTVRGLHELDELGGLIDLFDRVWDNDGPPPIGLEHLRALAHAGNYVVGAFDRETGTLLGGTVAFFAAPVGQVLHSDVTGVDPSARDRRLGFALKTDQRAWCLDRAIETVVWTFDPLIARNAYFNLVKLRARADRYFIDFYGDMDDGINAGQGSDRLFVTWDLTADDVADACTGRSEPPRRSDPAVPPLLSTTQSGPEIQTVSASTDVVRVEVPRDIEALRRADPALARAWRHGVRDTLGSELAAGGSIIGFDPAAGYVVKRSRGTPGGDL